MHPNKYMHCDLLFSEVLSSSFVLNLVEKNKLVVEYIYIYMIIWLSRRY